MVDKKRAILAHIFKYTFAQYVSQFLGFFTAIFMRRFLGPVYMGMWNLLKVVHEYSSHASLGAISAFCYKLPMLRGAGSEKEADQMNKVVFNFVMLTSFIYALSIIIFVVIFRKSYSLEMFIGFIVVSILVVVQRLYTYYITMLRAFKDFSILSKCIIFDAATNLLLTVIVLNRFKLYGLYFVVIIMPLLNMLFLKFFVKRTLKFSFNFRGLYKHVKFGAPLFIKNILDQVLNSMDRIMIASMLGLEQLGFYTIALMVYSYGGEFANNFSNVIQPYFMEEMGKKNDRETVRKYVIVSSQLTAFAMCFILSCIYIAAVPFIYYALPKFIPGIVAMKVFLLTTFFATITCYYYDYIVALGRQAIVIPVTIVIILINVFLNYIFIKMGYGINGVACSGAISALIYFSVISIYVLICIRDSINILSSLFAILFPLIYSAIVLAIITNKVIYSNMIVEALLRLMIFAISFLPLVYYLNKKTDILNIFISMLMKKKTYD